VGTGKKGLEWGKARTFKPNATKTYVQSNRYHHE
jgi:hypothetical protein